MSTTLTPAQQKARGAGIASGVVRKEKAQRRRVADATRTLAALPPPDLADAIREVVDQASPLTEQQRATISAILRGASR